MSTIDWRMTAFAPAGQTERYSVPIEGLLKKIQSTASSKYTRSWAGRTLTEWDDIRSTQMSSWLNKSAAKQSQTAILDRSTKRSALIGKTSQQSNRAVTRNLLGRSAGRLALVVALAVDAKELFDVEYQYRSGRFQCDSETSSYYQQSAE